MKTAIASQASSVMTTLRNPDDGSSLEVIDMPTIKAKAIFAVEKTNKRELVSSCGCGLRWPGRGLGVRNSWTISIGHRSLKIWYHLEKIGGRSAGERNSCERLSPRNHLGASGGGHSAESVEVGGCTLFGSFSAGRLPYEEVAAAGSRGVISLVVPVCTTGSAAKTAVDVSVSSFGASMSGSGDSWSHGAMCSCRYNNNTSRPKAHADIVTATAVKVSILRSSERFRRLVPSCADARLALEAV